MKKFENHLSNSGTFFYPLEFEGPFIQAKITEMQSGLPAPGITTYLSIPGTPFGFYVAQSDSSGMVRFSVKQHYGPGEIVLQAYAPQGRRYHISVINPFEQQIGLLQNRPATVQTPAAQSSLLQQSIAMQVQQLYYADSNEVFQLPMPLDTVPFYGKPDYSYALDIYTRFQTMEEVLREYVRPVNVTLRRGELQMYIFDEPRRRFFDGGELVLLDGIPLTNKNKLFNYDPLKIKRLDVITRRYFIGPMMFNGLASFTTYDGNYAGFTLDENTIVADYDGLQLQRNFFKPSYHNDALKSSRLPDYRTTLFWAPHLDFKTGESATTFYTSDIKGTYKIQIHGFSKNGEQLQQELFFTVQ